MQCKEMVLLIYRFTRTIKMKAAKLCSAELDPEDLQQEGYMALIDAVRSYEDSKGSFSAFAGKCIENRMKNTAAKAHEKLKKTDDYDFEQIADEHSSIDDHLIIKEYDTEIGKKLSSLLTEKEYNVLKLYLEGYTYKQIAEKLAVTVKAVDNSLLRTRKKLKNGLWPLH